MQNLMSSYSKHDLLTHKQEIELAKLIEKGSKTARDKLISSNFRLAMSIATKYTKNKDTSTQEDIIQESNIGLIKAADRYDWRKGFRFSTYACWWIRQSINKYVGNQTAHVKFPTGSKALIWKINSLRAEYFREFEVYPEDEEIASILGYPKEKITLLRSSMSWPVNLNDTVGGEDGGRTYAEVIPDDSPDPIENIDATMMISTLKSAFCNLKPVEEMVLRLRFGLSENADDNDKFPITESQIKKIQKRSKV